MESQDAKMRSASHQGEPAADGDPEGGKKGGVTIQLDQIFG
jgi:hypothetical protein